MKNKWKIFLATALAVAALVGVSVFIAADRREVWGHTDGLTDEEILQQLADLETEDFKRDVEKALAEGENSEISRLWIHTLFQRVDEYTDDELIENFLASSQDSLVPHIWMELYAEKYPDMDHNDPRFLAWLQDPQNGSGFKAALLFSVGFQTEEEISVLQELTKDCGLTPCAAWNWLGPQTPWTKLGRSLRTIKTAETTAFKEPLIPSPSSWRIAQWPETAIGNNKKGS